MKYCPHLFLMPGTVLWLLFQPTVVSGQTNTAVVVPPPAPDIASTDTSATGNVNTVETYKAQSYDLSHVGTPLNIDSFQQTFIDNFDKMDIVESGSGKATWYGPGHSAFGAAKFLPPGPTGPFTVKDGNLVITALKDPEGKWTSGLIQTVDKTGSGFSQQYGYFEMNAKFPPGKGSWPAFWLLSANGYTDHTKTRTELDVVEWYGGDPRGLHSSVHLWPAQEKGENYPLAKHSGHSNYVDLRKANDPAFKDGQLDGFHSYGCEVTPEWIIFYFDRKETGRFKTQPENRTPLYMLVNLTIFSKEAAVAESPKEMLVDYVAAYQHK